MPMSEPDGTQKTALQRPSNDDKGAWKAYWKTRGQPWRTEPEIDAKRQEYLAERRTIIPDIEQGIYPFKDIKLSRADVEWLVADHEEGRGPVDWDDERQRKRKGLDLRGADLRRLNLSRLPLTGMHAGSRHWSYATEDQHKAALAHLEGTSLVYAHLEGAYLGSAQLERALLCNAFFDQATQLNAIVLGNKKSGIASLVDVHWSDVNLAVVKWSQVDMLGEEYEARQKLNWDGKVKTRGMRVEEYERAVRANRQLATALQAQGLNEDAARFAYRAQKLQRVVLRRQRKFTSYLFSGFLDLLAGYGYRPIRSLFWYLVMICGFAILYWAFGHLPPFPDAFVFSLTSFHGRGFFPGLGDKIPLHNPLVVLAALEAVVGLFIEISFIATFTQRFFGK